MEFLGSGPAFPLRVNDRGGVAVSSEGERIRQSIRVILGTAKGERVMRPEFGCELAGMVFSVINSSTLTLVRSAVTEALTRWEPRIDVLEVRVFADERREGVLTIHVSYRIRRTNTEENLVYPYYLRGGGEA